jgi:hypothetical protein
MQSLPIIELYYTKFEPKILTSLCHIDHNVNLSLKQVVYSAIQSNLVISGTSNSLNEDVGKMTSLEMIPLDKFSGCLKVTNL